MVPSAVLNITKDRGQHVLAIIHFKRNIFRTIVESVLWDVKIDIARHACFSKTFNTGFHSLYSCS